MVIIPQGNEQNISYWGWGGSLVFIFNKPMNDFHLEYFLKLQWIGFEQGITSFFLKIFFVVCRDRSHSVARASFKLLGSSDPPALASQSVGIISVCHCTQPRITLFTFNKYKGNALNIGLEELKLTTFQFTISCLKYFLFSTSFWGQTLRGQTTSHSAVAQPKQKVEFRKNNKMV